MKRFLFLVILLAAPLAGCASRWEWEKDGVSAEEKARDIAKCRETAKERDRDQPYNDELPGTPSPSWRVEQFFDDCMRSKGYHAVRVHDESAAEAR